MSFPERPGYLDNMEQNSSKIEQRRKKLEERAAKTSARRKQRRRVMKTIGPTVAGVLDEDPRVEALVEKLDPQLRLQEMQERAARAREARAMRMAQDGLEGLTTLQRNFVLEYAFDFNPRRAYVRAGGSGSNVSGGVTSMMAHPKVRPLLDELDAKRAERLQVTPDAITRELSKMAFFNIESICDIDDRGRLVIDFSRADADVLACVQELKYDQYGNPVVKFTDKRSALELLGKVRSVKLFSEVTEHLDASGNPLKPPQLVVNFVDSGNALSKDARVVAAPPPHKQIEGQK